MKPRGFILWLVAFANFLVALSVQADTINLAGPWRFSLDSTDADIKNAWFKTNLADTIQLPGALQAQGFGNEIATNTPWVLSLYDKNWFLRADYQDYIKPGHVKVPFLCQPPRHYVGAAWYQRDFDLPLDWKESRVVLFLERPHWESRVWLDNQLIGTNNSLCAPHEFELGAHLAPGKHTLTIRVDNRMILPYRLDAHSVSDSLAGSWNGIIGKMELRSTPLVWIDDAQVFPNVAKKSALIKITIGNETGATGSGTVTAGSASLNASWDTNGGKAELEVPLGADAQTWDEFNPSLQHLTLQLQSAAGKDERELSFGLREFRAEGAKFVVNGRETYLRGTHNGGDFPLTGYPPTDVESWRKIFQTCKDWGLNHMRFHSFCPPDAAFQAADEAGIYLQIECGMWNELSPRTPMERMLYLETTRINRAYGNHPSFVMISASNEAHGNWKPCLTNWVEYFRAEDARHLYTPNTGWSLIDNPGPVVGADYLAVSRIGFRPLRGNNAWFGRDFAASLKGVNVPVVAHEVGQWCAYPDFDIIKKFTGYAQPGNYEIFRDSLAAHGLLERDHDFAWASGRFQLACYKEEIEANLRTPGLDGFQLLDLHDYTGQGTALVGLLDTFWENKGYTTPQEFREFCSATVPLARLKTRIFTSADPFDVDVEIAHYGAQPIPNIRQAMWKIEDAAGKVMTNARFPVRTIPIGKNTALGKISADLSLLPAPAAYKLVVSIEGTDIKNDWNFWVYPLPMEHLPLSDILITHSWDEAQRKLSVGGSVLFLPQTAELDWTSPPLAAVPVFWNRLMGPGWSRMLGLWCDAKHPALAEFPTETNCDWQWIDIVRNARAMNLDRLPRELQPIVQPIDDWNRNYKLGLVFECTVGAGRLMVCSADLEESLDTRPVARQLRRSLLDYMSMDQFKPKVAVSADDLKSLLFDTRIMSELGAAAKGSNSASNAIDGDPNTLWQAGTARGEAHYPYDLTINFPNPTAMSGLVCMPRQNDRDHLGDIHSYKIQASDDGQEWHDVTTGQLVSSFDPQQIKFSQTITTRHLKFTALSGFGADHTVALGDLAIIYAGPKLSEAGLGAIQYQNGRSTSRDIDEGPQAPPRKPAPKGSNQ